MEQESQESSFTHSDTHKPLPHSQTALLLTGAVALVGIFVVLLFVQYAENGRDVPSTDDIVVVQPPVIEDVSRHMISTEPTRIQGYVAGIIEGLDSKEKWIALSVALPESAPMPTSDTGVLVGDAGVTKTVEYLFYFDGTLPGTEDITGGETIEIAFFDIPSETEYRGVSEVRVVQ